MTSRRSKAKPTAETTITGVAAGSLGTAANLDDTQVFRTDDLEQDAPDWLADDAPAIAAPARARRARPVGVRSSISSRRSLPALAGVAALVLLLMVAGSGFLSTLDLGIGTGPARPAATANALVEARPSPTAEPKEAGKGKCHGKGHGDSCNGH